MQRGVHSTGVARVWHNKHRPPEVKKDVLPAMYFFSQKDNRNILEDTSPVAILGHCRFATVGNHDDIRGAHPFTNDRYVGFHNGTLKEKKYTEDDRFMTDSESLYKDLEERGMNNVLPGLYEESAFALMYYDKVDHQLGFVRNTRRPLSFAVNQKRDVVYCSSDIEDLRYALNKHDVDYSDYTLGAWQNIRTNPRSLSFSKPEKGEDRTNLWHIDKLEPKPETPPKEEKEENNVYSFYPRGSYTSTKTKDSGWNALGCKVCDEPLSWAAAGMSKTKNPKYVKDFGNICYKCQTLLEDSYAIDLDSDTAALEIGTFGISPVGTAVH